MHIIHNPFSTYFILLRFANQTEAYTTYSISIYCISDIISCDNDVLLLRLPATLSFQWSPGIVNESSVW